MALALMSQGSKSGELGRFLTSELGGRGDQKRFAKWARIAPASINRWMHGQAIPTFDNCLQIALYWRIDPYRVFEMAGQSEFARLARAIGVPGGPPPEPWRLYSEPERMEAHRRLDLAIEAGLSERAEERLAEASSVLGLAQRRLADLRSELRMDGLALEFRGRRIAAEGEAEGEADGSYQDPFHTARILWWGNLKRESDIVALKAVAEASGARMAALCPPPSDQ